MADGDTNLEQVTGVKTEHSPRAPYVPTELPHRYQRWFRGEKGSPYEMGVFPAVDRWGALAEVYRDSEKDVAELRMRVHHGPSDFRAEIELEPAALRETARCLLDAAHDIEAYPAAVLSEELRKAREQAQSGESPCS